MDKKTAGNVSLALNTIGILALLAAALDILPVADNVLIFAGIALFIVAASIRRLSK